MDLIFQISQSIYNFVFFYFFHQDKNEFSSFIIFDYVSCLISIYMMTNSFLVLKYFEERSFNQEKNEKRFFFPKVSVLIPARNEEKNIAKCLHSIMKQNYDNFEVLVMDDGSSDKTFEILERIKLYYEYNPEYSKGKLTYYKNKSLPKGWYGKSYSVHSLAQKATGDIFFITDADTIHEKSSLLFCVSMIEKLKIDFLSGFPYQHLNSFGEKLIVPSMYIASSYLLPLYLIEKIQNHHVSIAIGQCMVFKRKAYQKIGGFSCTRNEICEDIKIAKILKKNNFKISFVDLTEHIQCKMYNSFTEAFFGISKTIYSALEDSFMKFFTSGLIFFGVLYPFYSLPFYSSIFSLKIKIFSIFLFSYSWIKTLKSLKVSPYIALFYPLMFLTLTFISIYASYIKFFRKGFIWKGRKVN